MTDAEWKTVEAALAHPFGEGVELLCDGYRLTLAVVPVRKLQFAIQIYVDGLFKGIWSNPKEPCEEQRRFMRETSIPMIKPKELDMLKRIYSKLQYADAKAKRFVWYHGHWPTFAPLRRHLVKHNQVISLVRPAPAAAPSGAVLAGAALAGLGALS